MKTSPAVRFAAEQWLTRAVIGDEVSSMLPKGSVTLDARAIGELKAWFGPDGRSPAVTIQM